MSLLFQVKRAVSLLFLVGSALTLYNLYSSNDTVIAQAEGVACGGKGCVRLIRAERSAFAQTFTFQISLQPPATAGIRCERSYVLLGPYTCVAIRPS
jgi:hypothetical protein